MHRLRWLLAKIFVNFTIVDCYHFCLWYYWSLLMLPMKRCCTYRDRDPISLNTLFEDSLNDIVDEDLNTLNSPFLITSPYMCTESVSNLVRDKNLITLSICASTFNRLPTLKILINFFVFSD